MALYCPSLWLDVIAMRDFNRPLSVTTQEKLIDILIVAGIEVNSKSDLVENGG